MRTDTLHGVAATAKGRRLDLGWSQAETASHAGVSRKWVSDFETGRTSPDLATTMRLLRALGLVFEIVPVSAVHRSGASVDLDELLSHFERR